MKKLILLIIVGIFCISLVSATQSSLGVFEQGKDIDLIQTCATCTYNNVTTIKMANGTLLDINDVMTKNGSFYNYTLLKNYTTSMGEYLINGIGDLDGTDTIWVYDLRVTYTGKELSSSSSIFYIVLFTIFLAMGILLIFFINRLPNANVEDKDGYILQISWGKYLRSTLWFILWLFVVAMLFITSNLAFAYLEDTLIANFLFVLWRIAMGFTLPIVIVWFIFIFVRIADDRKIRKLWERGMFPQGKL